MKINARTPVKANIGFEAPATILSVVVPYTTPELTKAALRHAAVLSGELAPKIRLIDVHVVPFPCPVDQPTVRRDFLETRLREAAEENTMPVRAEIVYTRDRLQGLLHSLRPASLIVIATRRRWWPTAEKKLARSLIQAGHEVALLEC